MQLINQSLESELHSLCFLRKYEELQSMLLLSIEENEALESRLTEAEDIIHRIYCDFDFVFKDEYLALDTESSNSGKRFDDFEKEDLRLRAEEAEDIIRLIKQMFQVAMGC